MSENEQMIYCKRCRKRMRAINFYIYQDLERFPNGGKIDICKQCLTAHLDNWKPETYLDILEMLDVPYVPEQWAKLMNRYARNGKKLTGTTILGRYLSAMKLNQYKEFRWKDTEFLQEMANSKIEETMRRQGYGAAEIAQVINTGTQTISPDIVPPQEDLPILPTPEPEIIESEPEEDYFLKQAKAAPTFDLTEEDRTYLLLKWGKAYKPEEWVKLEQLYEEMMESYDIQSAGHIDTLKLICKASLKANQLIDIGDIEGFQKISRVYDSLMKSGKFKWWTVKNLSCYRRGIDYC